MKREAEVTIIGAGLTGLTLAYWLRDGIGMAHRITQATQIAQRLRSELKK